MRLIVSNSIFYCNKYIDYYLILFGHFYEKINFSIVYTIYYKILSSFLSDIFDQISTLIAYQNYIFLKSMSHT